MSLSSARDWIIVALAIVLGYSTSMLIDRVPGVSPEVLMVLQFPVSSGAVIALLLELVLPKVRSPKTA